MRILRGINCMRYDVIIVGAGPAGSTAARAAALRGLTVLMLDRAEFPRDKPCGGALTTRCADVLDLDLTPVIERTIRSVNFTWRRRLTAYRSTTGTVASMSQRRNLDTFLAEKAVEAGVDFRQREGIRSVERTDSQVTVWAGDTAYRGRTLVAADGANGVTARMAGIPCGFLHSIALEGNITPQGGFPPTWETCIGVDFGGLPGGYGWVFPKGDHLNFGLGGWQHVGPTLRTRLNRFVESYGFTPSSLWGVRGHHLPIKSGKSKFVDGNTLLVGDAAGVIDPFTAEGIYGAAWTGKVAAASIEDYLAGESCSLDSYGSRVGRELLPELAVGRQLHDIFHLCPSFFVEIERTTSILWPALVGLLEGKSTYVKLTRDLRQVWPLLEFLSDSIRVLPPLRRISGLPERVLPERFFRQ